MKFFTRIALLFYVITITAIGVLMILFASRIDSNLVSQATYYLNITANDLQIRLIIGVVGIAFIMLSFLFARIISGARQKERTIAFDNPSGRVTISLFAMEDMVKRLAMREPEVKEVRANMIATKKGLDIEARLTLKADVNIPELTARLQDSIKYKIQEMIGLEETVTVRIHVMKISTEEVKSKRYKGDFPERPDQPTPTIPFQGYRA